MFRPVRTVLGVLALKGSLTALMLILAPSFSEQSPQSAHTLGSTVPTQRTCSHLISQGISEQAPPVAFDTASHAEEHASS